MNVDEVVASLEQTSPCSWETQVPDVELLGHPLGVWILTDEAPPDGPPPNEPELEQLRAILKNLDECLGSANTLLNNNELIATARNSDEYDFDQPQIWIDRHMDGSPTKWTIAFGVEGTDFGFSVHFDGLKALWIDAGD